MFKEGDILLCIKYCHKSGNSKPYSKYAGEIVQVTMAFTDGDFKENDYSIGWWTGTDFILLDRYE